MKYKYSKQQEFGIYEKRSKYMLDVGQFGSQNKHERMRRQKEIVFNRIRCAFLLNRLEFDQFNSIYYIHMDKLG